MPINLTQLSQNNKAYTPKWFDKKLTGSGKKTGLLNMDRNPINLQTVPVNTQHPGSVHKKHRTIRQGTTTTTIIPLAVFSHLDYASLWERERPRNIVHLGTHNNNEVHVYAEPYCIIIEETTTDSYNKKEVEINWNLHVFVGPKGTTLYKPAGQAFNQSAYFIVELTTNPYEMLTTILNQVTSMHPSQALLDKAKEFIKDLDLYQAVTDAATHWNTTIHEDIKLFLKNHQTLTRQKKLSITYASPQSTNLDTWLAESEDILVKAIKRLEQYVIPLENYSKIYNAMKQNLKKDIVTHLCKQNINLLMADTLENMKKSKKKLKTVPVPSTPWVNAFYSAKQKAAIQSTGPLTLVQAGAGVGKSQCILGRMEYMRATGIDPKTIAVLSFTNAAANHILEKEPNVRSSTIASMIHDIYQHNWDHELSNLDTIINCLDIHYDSRTNSFISEFKHCLIKLNKNDNDAFTYANNFIEEHIDQVLKTLDHIKQTTLELEQIICYLMMKQIQEPANSIPDHIIVDEVQDTSIFEFIFILNYTIKHKTSLFMVGDCSQTLYEFRSSNPRALNTLEASGIFDTFALDINYRSNQEILDFANTALADIEANQFAKIQLHANSMTPINKDSFRDKVNFAYRQIPKMTELCTYISADLAHSLTDYIKDCFAKKEQIAILAYSRREISEVEHTLTTLYPNRKISNLVPKKQFTSTILSKYIKKFWEETSFYPTKDFLTHVEDAIINRLDQLTFMGSNTKQAIQNMLGDFHKQYGNLIATYEYQVSQKIITKDQMRDQVKDLMLKYEINLNSIKQSLNAKDNELNRKDTSGDFILSTIHSAKGLEFDNVIVIYRCDNNMDEPEKRMYYVAMTRAMKTEYVCAYGTIKYPKISVDYAKTISRLPGNLPKDFVIPGLPIDEKNNNPFAALLNGTTD